MTSFMYISINATAGSLMLHKTPYLKGGPFSWFEISLKPFSLWETPFDKELFPMEQGWGTLGLSV